MKKHSSIAVSIIPQYCHKIINFTLENFFFPVF